MPAAQVINFGEDPYANAVGGFARNFLSKVNENTAQKRNEDLFKRISDNYGPDTDPQDIMRDLIKSEGMDPEFKRNKLKEVGELAELTHKKNKSGYDNAILGIRQQDLLARQRNNLNLAKQNENKADENARKASTQVQKYTKDIFEEKKFTPDQILKGNAEIERLMKGGTSMSEAAQMVAEAKDQYDFLVNDAPFPEKPSVSRDQHSPLGFQPDPEALQQAMKIAVTQLDEAYNLGITSQTDLKKMARRGGWSESEVLKMVQDVLKRHGKNMAGPKPKTLDEQYAEDDALLFGS